MRRNKLLFFIVIVSVCLLLSATVAMAASSGGMSGQVRGWTPSQKASGAVVTAYKKQSDGSYVFQAQSPPADTNGNYSITLLPAGTYRVSYSHPTFGLMWYNQVWTQTAATDQVVTSSGLGAFALQYVKTNVPVTFDFGAGLGTSSPSPLPSVGDLLTQPTAPSNPGYQIAGWYKEPTFATAWNFATSTVPTAPLTLYAKWTKASYTVTYNSNSGSTVGSQSVQYQSLLTAPSPNPTRAYYTFGGWYKDASLATAWNFASDTMPGNAMTLYAKWIPNTYTVSFNSNSGSTVPSILVDYNALVPQPLSPTREGHTFVGWYSDAALTNSWNFASGLMGPGNITLYAKWSTNSYAVSFSSNGGSNVSGTSVAFGAKVTEPTAPTKTGYSFVGWYADEALNTPWVFATNTMPASAITLYAKWSINSYDVSYVSNGGSATANDSVVYNTLVTKPGDPSKAGYSFIGWYSNEALSSSWNFATDKMPASALTLYAKWDANHYTASFDSNEGSSVDAQEVDFGELVTKPANPTKEGYTFTGWFNGTTEWNFTTDTMPMGGVNLSAHWVINSYAASFDSAGGSKVDSQEVDFGGLVTKPADPTREGYTFEGWFKNASAWNFSTNTMPANDVELTAQWSVNSYNVSFDSAAGTPVDSQEVNFDALVTKPSNPTKEGYTFAGWFNGETEWNFTVDKMPATELELVANWSINTYTVSFNSGSGTPVESQDVDFGGLVAKPADPTRTGYTFVRWSYLASAWDFASDTLPASDIELVAEWEVDTYTASFDSDGGTLVGSQDVDFGALITKPADPSKEGYTFAGWFDGETEWDFATDTMPVDGVDLIGHWTPVSYKATFDPANGDSTDSQDVDFGELITKPIDPSKEGYTFAGWFDGEAEWDFATDTMPVDGVSLIAHWGINSYIASFNSNGGDSVNHQDVDFGALVTKPTDPSKEGYTFAGWFDGETEWDFTTDVMPANDLELAAHWSINTYTASFESDGGTPVSSQDVDFDSLITKPADPTKEGYTFAGWFNGETEWDFTTDVMPADGVALTAHWTTNAYTASFESDGGTPVGSQDVDFDSLITKPADPTKEGYTFAGWFNGETEWDFSTDVMPANDLELAAHWTTNAYTVSFDSNGGTAVDSQDVDFGGLVTKPSDPTKEGYTFTGWFEAGTAWDFSSNVMPSYDVELYAAWEANIYTARYNSNGGTPVHSQDASFGSLLTEPTDPTREGYTFVGWFIGSNMPPAVAKSSVKEFGAKSIIGGGVQWNFGTDTMPIGGVTLVAHWTINSYTAAFESDGGTPVDSQDVDFGGLVTQPADPSKEGYTFAGWFNGETEWDFTTDTMPIDGITLTAHWTINTYTASFESDGGTPVDSQDVDFGGLITQPADPSKEGYTFAGWFNGETEWDFTTDTMPADGVTLTAHWTTNTYAVSFDSDSGSSVDSQDVDFGSYITEPAQPNREGYGFVGWFFEGNLWHFDTDTMPAGDITLVAQWTQHFHHVTFDSNGGSAVEGADVAVGSLVGAPVDPTRTGYTFTGWFDGETEWDFASDVMPENDITLTAAWKIKTIKVVVHIDGETTPQEETVNFGQEIVPPTAPSKTGYDFVGWYTDEDLTHPFVPGTTAALTDISLYAKWAPVQDSEFTVTFNSTGGSTIPAAQVGPGGSVTLPKPSKPGFSFAGWFTSPTGGTKVTMLTAINSNVILYARWISNDPYIKSTTISKGTLTPTFTRKKLTYNVYFTGISNQIVIRVIKPHPAATMSVRVGLTTWRKATTMTMNVRVGQTKTVYFKSVAQDGKTTKTYTYHVFHAWDK